MRVGARYILIHGQRHPLEMGEAEINAFLTHLAVEGGVSPSTQIQALCAVLVPDSAVAGDRGQRVTKVEAETVIGLGLAVVTGTR